MIVACQNNKHLVTTSLTPHLLQRLHRHFVSPSTLILQRCSPSCSHMHTLTQFKTAYPQHTHKCDIQWSLSLSQTHAYIQHSPTQGTMLRVKRRDPDGSHLVCADGLLRWLRTGYGHTHRWRPTESGWEMDVLTIDLLRSMIHNLVIWHWGSYSHWAGTSAWHIGHTSLHLCRVKVN